MKTQPQIQKLPGRGALNAIGKSQRTIADYAKATPFSADAVSPVLQLLRKPKGK